MGTKAGGRDAASESRAAAELISARLPPSPPQPPPTRAAAPSVPLPCRGGGPGSPPSCPSRPSPAASGSPTLHLSWGRRRVQRCPSPLLCAGTRAGAVCPRRLAAAHRGSPTPAAPEPAGAPPPLPPGTPMPPARGSGDWDIWERTARPFARHRHPPARAGLPSPWHVPSPRSVAAGGTGLAVPTGAMVGAGSRR